jgi:hypothetical protein
VESEMIQRYSNLLKRIVLINSYIVCLLVLPIVLNHWIWIYILLGLVFIGTFGLILGSIGYSYSFEIGFIAFLGWIILGSSYFIQAGDYHLIYGLVLLIVSIPSLNFFALKSDFKRKDLSSEQKQERKYELGAVIALTGFVFLFMGALAIVSGIAHQKAFYYPYGVILILGAVFLGVGIFIIRKYQPPENHAR